MTFSDGMTEVEYGYWPSLCSSFDEVLRKAGDPARLDDLLNRAVKAGRLLLQAPGGSGKTYTLERLVELAQGRGIPVLLLRLADQPILDIEHFGLAAVLAAAEPSTTVEDLQAEEPFLLLIDGLNEVDRKTGDLLLSAVDELADRFPASGTVVSDRMARRPIDDRRWVLATLTEVPRTSIENLLGRTVSDAEASLLASPVYLEQEIDAAGSAGSRSASHARYLVEQLRIDQNALQSLAEHALSDYRRSSSRLFDFLTFTDRIGRPTAAALVEAEAVLIVGADDNTRPLARWRHHLLHDYLAALAASDMPASWDAQLFETLTFKASSNDSLVMLLELARPDQRDRLVRLVYDWNLYAAAYLLAEDRAAMVRKVTATEVIALLGERRFDPILATAQQAEDALVLIGGEAVRELMATQAPERAVSVAQGWLPEDSEYQEWLQIFGVQDRTAAKRLVPLLTDEDGVIGWTTANVIRRLEPRGDAVNSLRVLTSHTSAVVRWRAVHALGTAGRSATDDLFRALCEDTDNRVRYGALRSIVEQAYHEEVRLRRDRTFRRLAKSAPLLLAQPALSSEFSRILRVANPPEGWASSAGLVVQRLLSEASSNDEQERWRRLSANLRLKWQLQPA